MPASARLLALLISASLVPGCGWLVVTIADATRGPPGPLTESAHVSGRTTGGPARRAISCGAASGSPQNEHAFVAPVAGTYTFDSTTSDYDGVLAVYDASGNELGCNDDHGSTRASEVIVMLAEGQSVTVVQGGYAGGAGSYELWVSGSGGAGPTGSLTLDDGTVVAVTPGMPPQELSLDASVLGDTSGLGAIADVSCPPASPMQEWRFTAPDDGTYLFQVDSSYGASVGVLDETGMELGCSGDFEGSAHASVAVDLESGSVARVIVGGVSSQSGSYSLMALRLANGGAITLGQPVLFVAGGTSSEGDLCGAQPGSVDRTFTFTPRAEAFYVISTDVTATLVVDDGRRTMACIPLSPDRRVGLVLKAGHRYSLVLELGYPDDSLHTLEIERADPEADDW